MTESIYAFLLWIDSTSPVSVFAITLLIYLIPIRRAELHRAQAVFRIAVNGPVWCLLPGYGGLAMLAWLGLPTFDWFAQLNGWFSGAAQSVVLVAANAVLLFGLFNGIGGIAGRISGAAASVF